MISVIRSEDEIRRWENTLVTKKLNYLRIITIINRSALGRMRTYTREPTGSCWKVRTKCNFLCSSYPVDYHPTSYKVSSSLTLSTPSSTLCNVWRRRRWRRSVKATCTWKEGMDTVDGSTVVRLGQIPYRFHLSRSLQQPLLIRIGGIIPGRSPEWKMWLL